MIEVDNFNILPLADSTLHGCGYVKSDHIKLVTNKVGLLVNSRPLCLIGYVS